MITPTLWLQCRSLLSLSDINLCLFCVLDHFKYNDETSNGTLSCQIQLIMDYSTAMHWRCRETCEAGYPQGTHIFILNLLSWLTNTAIPRNRKHCQSMVGPSTHRGPGNTDSAPAPTAMSHSPQGELRVPETMPSSHITTNIPQNCGGC
jgi:hypothetical protein